MKILLAEDDVSLASMMHKGLSEKGYEVTVAQDGHTALSMALDNNFRLMILDVMLPGINGLEISCLQFILYLKIISLQHFFQDTMILTRPQKGGSVSVRNSPSFSRNPEVYKIPYVTDLRVPAE